MSGRTVEAFRADCEARKELADGDPEIGHGDVDDLVEEALRGLLAAPEDPDAIAKAILAVDLLDTEKGQGWRRWYA